MALWDLKTRAVFIADYFFVAAILEIGKLAKKICKISNGIWQI